MECGVVLSYLRLAHAGPHADALPDAEAAALYGDPPGGKTRKHNFSWNFRNNGDSKAERVGR